MSYAALFLLRVCKEVCMLCIGMTSMWSWERGEEELCFMDMDGEGKVVEYMYSYVYTLLYIS